MGADVPADIRELQDQLEAAERDAEALVAGLSDAQGSRAAEVGQWSVAQCLDHLATGNRVYLRAMQESANRARTRGRHRRRPARAGWVGRLFVSFLEPPPKWWSTRRAPRKIRPRAVPPLAETFASFVDAQSDVRAFLSANADLDLVGIRFPNPFVRGVFFTLATGLHVLAAHERRHLWQAWQVRRAIERAEE
ncbi:MAG TPA: DinB family protein [Thermoanaerobaculia bacterium]|nr:DinB family protein [Thermoanaerobaculia bacterium]